MFECLMTSLVMKMSKACGLITGCYYLISSINTEHDDGAKQLLVKKFEKSQFEDYDWKYFRKDLGIFLNENALMIERGLDAFYAVTISFMLFKLIQVYRSKACARKDPMQLQRHEGFNKNRQRAHYISESFYTSLVDKNKEKTLRNDKPARFVAAPAKMSRPYICPPDLNFLDCNHTFEEEEDSELCLLNAASAQNVEALPDTLRTVISSHGDVLDFTTVTEMQTLKTAKAAIPDTISHHGDENSTYTAEERVPSPVDLPVAPPMSQSFVDRPIAKYEDHLLGRGCDMLQRQYEIEENNRRMNLKFSSLLNHLQNCKNRLSRPKVAQC